eukprot:scaffold13045_cov266-Ochromonas_danica.AAC.3
MKQLISDGDLLRRGREVKRSNANLGSESRKSAETDSRPDDSKAGRDDEKGTSRRQPLAWPRKSTKRPQGDGRGERAMASDGVNARTLTASPANAAGISTAKSWQGRWPQ